MTCLSLSQINRVEVTKQTFLHLKLGLEISAYE